jgi:hypothetical protein
VKNAKCAGFAAPAQAFDPGRKGVADHMHVRAVTIIARAKWRRSGEREEKGRKRQSKNRMPWGIRATCYDRQIYWVSDSCANTETRPLALLFWIPCIVYQSLALPLLGSVT